MIPTPDGSETNGRDLGADTLEWRNLYLDGTAHIDTLDVDIDATITRDLTVNRHTVLNGNVTLGSANDDNIVINGRIDNSLIPDNDNAFDLGASNLEWKDLFLDGTAHIDTLDVDANAGIVGNLTVTGTALFNGGAAIASGKDFYSNNGAFIVSDTNGAFAARTGNNIDHIWHDESDNAWNFVSDSTYKSAGNSKIKAHSFYGNGANISSINASNITSGTIADARIPNLNASKINAGTFATARIPNLDASKITSGTISDARLPSSISSNITGNAASADTIDVADQTSEGVIRHLTYVNGDGSARDLAMSNNLKYRPSTNTFIVGNVQASIDAQYVNSGTLNSNRIPNLSASKINSGTFATGRIPDLNGNKITSGTIAPARLGSGSGSSTKFLNGDGEFKTVTVAINSISGDGANRVLTSDGDGTATAESTLQYDGTTLQVATGNNYFRATKQGVVTMTGSITANGNITAFNSDIRLKTAIQPIENAVAKVLKLNGFTYELNELAETLGYELDGERYAGVSAQDVKEVLPEAVKPAPASADYLTVQYEKLVPLLIEAIKELKSEIEELKK